MLCCDCRQFIVTVLTSIILASCNYVQGSPSVAVLGGEAYMRWTISTTTSGNRFVLDPANKTIIGFTSNKTQPRFEAPNVSYTGDISQGTMSFTLLGVTQENVGRYKYTLSGNIEDGGQDLVIAESPTITNITNLSPPAVVGGNSKLNCTAVSTSIPVNHNLAMLSEWKRNGMNIDLGSKYSVIGTILVVNNLVRADNGDRFTCVAYEDPRKKSEESGEFLINVLYGPDSVQITPTGDLTVDEEGPVNITCSAECNPVCENYHWQNGTDHTLVALKQTLVIPKVRREQAGLYICNVTNDVILLSATSQIKVSVNYGPDNPLQLSPSNTSYRVQEGSKISNISCTSPCFPPCDFEWTGPVNSSAGIISLGTVHRSKRGSYTCKGKNPNTSKEASSGLVAIDVIFGPDIPVILPSNTLYRLNESNVLPTIQCLADCYPNCTSLWYNGTTAVLRSQDNILILDKVYRNDAGNYTCRSVNMESKAEGEKILQLVVQYPPIVTMDSRNGSDSDKGVMLNCSAYGIPQQYTYKLTHSSLFTGSEIRQLDYSYISTGIIVHQFTNLSYMDTGIYTCSVNNGILDYRDSSLYTSVTRAVWIKGKPYLTSMEPTSYAEKGHSGRLLVEFYNSLLDAQVMWYRLKNETQEYLQNSDKYNFNISGTMVNVTFYSINIQQPGLMASLEIRDIEEEDFAAYEVHVKNSIGMMSPVTLMLKPKGNGQHINGSHGDAIIIGSVIGTVVIVVALVGLLFYRRRKISKLDSDGLVENPVYDTSVPAVAPFNNSSATEVVYTEVTKKKVLKAEGQNNVYAKVDNTQKSWKKDVYENADLMGKCSKPEYTDQNVQNTKAEPCDENVYEDPVIAASNGYMKNNDSLLYADLMLDPPPTTMGKVVIRGIENCTQYAEIAYRKKGEPPPESGHGKENKSEQ